MGRMYYDVIFKSGKFYSGEHLETLPSAEEVYGYVRLEETYVDQYHSDYDAFFVDIEDHLRPIQLGGTVIHGFRITGPLYKRQLELVFENPRDTFRTHRFIADVSSNPKPSLYPEWNDKDKYISIIEYIEGVNEAGYTACEVITNLRRDVNDYDNRLANLRETYSYLDKNVRELSDCIEELSIPDGTTSYICASGINLKSLRRFFLPATLEQFDFKYSCDNLEEIWCKSLIPPKFVSGDNISHKCVKLYVPKEAIGAYMEDEQIASMFKSIKGY